MSECQRGCAGQYQQQQQLAMLCPGPGQPACRPVDLEDLANLYGLPVQQQQQQQQCAGGPGQPGCSQMGGGPVDLEDLATFCSLPAAQPEQQQQQQPVQVEEPWYPMSVHEAAFAFCTDSRWMACPATAHCPLYTTDPSHQPIDSWNLLPCATDFYTHYLAQDDLLEEYLSNEKRKEKSRDAARCRRSRETDIFTELAGALPVSPCDVANLDKASVMRLAIAYLKTRTLMDSVSRPLTKRENSPEMDELFVKALDGFVLAVDNNGDMAYLSPNVKNYLGIAQMDLMGQSVFDYSHPCDHDEIRESLCVKPSETGEDQPCNFFIRLKCTLTSKGRKVNLKSASYRVIHCTGRVIAHTSNSIVTSNEDNEADKPEESVEKEAGASLVVVASPVPHPSNIEIPLGKYTFLSKHNLNMKFTYADDKLAEFLGWEGSDLIGQSVLDFHHALDNSSLDKSFKSLFHKGQCETAAYRFLNKRGGYAWVVTQATLIHCSRLHKPLSVVCVNYMISGVECEDEVYSVRQLEARTNRSLTSSETRKPLAERNGQQQQQQLLGDKDKKEKKEEEVRAKPQAVVKARPRLALPAKENTLDQCTSSQLDQLAQVDRAAVSTATLLVEPVAEPVAGPVVGRRSPSETTTETIFVPRTEDMSKGFLTFSEDNDGITMLKDEPEDLTHLAPMAGDVCVPLEEPPFLSDMLDEFMLSSANYCPLLGPDDDDEDDDEEDELDEEDRSRRRKPCELLSSPTSTSLRRNEPFLYPDSPGLTNSPEMSDSLGSSRNEACCGGGPATGGTPAGGGGGGGSGGGLSDDEMLMLSMSDVMADDEMSIRAPFIPMSDQDEALQLLISDDMVMWGGGPTHSTQSTHKKSKWLTDTMDEGANSSLAQLLMNEASSQNKARPQQQQQQQQLQQQQAVGEMSSKGITRKEGKRVCGKRVLALPGRPGPLDTAKRPKHCGQFDLEDALSMHSSQLLHQLVSHQQHLHQQHQQQHQQQQQQQAKTGLGCWPARSARPGHDPGLEGDRGGGKLEPPPPPLLPPAPQSSSVLMNLLVSGCDMQAIQNPMCNANIRAHQQQKQQQQHQQLQNQQLQQNMDQLQFLQQNKMSTQQMNLEKLQTVPEWTHPASRGFDNPKQQPQQQQHHQNQDLVTMNYDEFMKNIFEENDELLCALDPNLV